MKYEGKKNLAYWKIDNDNIFEMKLTSLACPVQFEGKLKDGNYFYFRERHGWTTFTIARSQKEAYSAYEGHALYFIRIPEAHFAYTAAKRINEWVNHYFDWKKEEENSIKDTKNRR